MPCNSDYLKPHSRERELQRAAKLLVYVLTKTGGVIEQWMVNEAANIYADKEIVVPLLCAALQALPANRREELVYDAHSRMARDLANWWEDHQVADANREV